MMMNGDRSDKLGENDKRKPIRYWRLFCDRRWWGRQKMMEIANAAGDNGNSNHTKSLLLINLGGEETGRREPINQTVSVSHNQA